MTPRRGSPARTSRPGPSGTPGEKLVSQNTLFRRIRVRNGKTVHDAAIAVSLFGFFEECFTA